MGHSAAWNALSRRLDEGTWRTHSCVPRTLDISPSWPDYRGPLWGSLSGCAGLSAPRPHALVRAVSALLGTHSCRSPVSSSAYADARKRTVDNDYVSFQGSIRRTLNVPLGSSKPN